jgi:TctA family transporter
MRTVTPGSSQSRMLLPFAVALGALLGIGLSLVPGLHVATVLAILVAAGLSGSVPPGVAAAAVAAAAGASLYARRLALVYHPAANTSVHASLDPALRLTKAGRAADAMAVATAGTDMAIAVGTPVVVVIGIGLAAGFDLIGWLDGAVKFLGVPVICFWVVHTVFSANAKGLTAVGFGAAALFGYTTLNHPSLSPDHAIAPVLAGLFGIPLMLQVLSDRHGRGLPQQFPVSKSIDVNTQLGLLGTCIGALTGFFAGLGTSSLVSLAAGSARNDEDYLLLASAGEASNDLMAIVLAVVAGLSRSGEAVLLTRIAPEPGAATGTAIVLALAVGAFVGRYAVIHLQAGYQRFVETTPVSVSAVFVLATGMVPIALAGAAGPAHLLVAFGLTAAGTLLGCWCRQQELPAQVPFGALAIPLVIQAAGFGPGLRALVFGN